VLVGTPVAAAAVPQKDRDVLAQLLAFVAVAAAVICTPGPDTALTVRNTLVGGRRGGVLTAAGVALGQLVWTVAASVGIAGLLQASEPAFRAVQLAGAAYLVVLGAQSLWAAYRGTEAHVTALPGRDRPGRALWQGLVSNLANPKMAAFFLSLLPQFVPAGTGSFAGFLVLGAVFCLMTFLWLTGYSVAVHGARRLFDRSAVRRTVDAVAGGLLVAFGVRLAVSSG
jgi:threonine/homoserine/homoserine lactone efflux protein